MKKLLFISLILFIPFAQSCKNSSAFSNNNGDEPELENNDHLTMAVLYQQSAAEYHALCYQAFNIAKIRLDESTKMMGGMKANAVVVDIDETMLDNSPYEAKCILEAIHYPMAWGDWMDSASAKAVPGALEFAIYAEKMGVQIYYISNRKDKYRQQTLKNLKAAGFPFADEDHILLRTDGSSKKERREKVMAKNNIIMLIGDNLNDFTEVFEKKSTTERFALTQKMSNDFGGRFIVLPNAMYGDWDSALYNYDHSQSETDKADQRKKALIAF